jgi:hypothetical protein
MPTLYHLLELAFSADDMVLLHTSCKVSIPDSYTKMCLTDSNIDYVTVFWYQRFEENVNALRHTR